MERLSRKSWQPHQGKVQYERYLSSHEKLPEMGRGPLIGFVDNADQRSVRQHQEYVHRASSKAASATADSAEQVQATMAEAGEPIEAGASEAGPSEFTGTSGESDMASSNPS